MKRRLKQLIYLGIFVGFWCGVGIAVWQLALKPTPSCLDNRQNQGEEGVDCGGPCARFCIDPNLAPVSVVGTPRTFNPSPDLVVIVVTLRNPNPRFAAPQVPYTITTYGEQGKSVTDEGTSYIYAGETKQLIVIRPSVGIGRATSAQLTLGSPVWIPASRWERPTMRIQDASVVVGERDGVRVRGMVANDDAGEVGSVTVQAVFVDGRGEPLGASQTVVGSLAAGETAPFSIAHPPLTGIDTGATRLTVTGRRP